MIHIKIYAGDKARFVVENGINYYYFCCIDKDDVYTVYDALAENIRLKNSEKDLINFKYLKVDNVNTLLQDAKKYGFISDYEID